MSSLAAKTLIKAEFTANWTGAPWFDLADYINLADVPVANETNTWLGLEFPPASDARVTIGIPIQSRETGLVVIHCMVPDGFPATVGDTLAEQARNFLRWKRLGNLTFGDINTPQQYQNDLGAFRDFAFTCNYYFDQFTP